jgi:hypothetical protein
MSFLWHNAIQFAIALDQALNVVIGTLTGRVAYSDESMSAHCWRSYRDGKVWGKLLMPPIDWLFSWQKADPTITDATGEPIKGHCQRAYRKELERRYLPPEYR